MFSKRTLGRITRSDLRFGSCLAFESGKVSRGERDLYEDQYRGKTREGWDTDVEVEVRGLSQGSLGSCIRLPWHNFYWSHIGVPQESTDMAGP